MQRVSIPFKREGTCEHRVDVLVDKPKQEFQFPSNGKARVNAFYSNNIPIKGEEFQFPSNGKARVNAESQIRLGGKEWTFQFPSNGKARVNENGKLDSVSSNSFNSLQTGRHVWTKKKLNV